MDVDKWIWFPLKASLVTLVLVQKGIQSFSREDLGCEDSAVGTGWVFGWLAPLQHFCRLINPQKAHN